MQIFLHTTTGLAVHNVDDQTTVEAVAAELGLADASAWLEDDDDALDPTAVVAKAAGVQGHIHVNRCRSVEVTINFAGKQKTHTFAPGTTVQAVRQWAVGPNGFDLPQKERPKHEVGVCGTGVIAERTDHVGTIATDCGLCLDLAPKDRFQG